MGMKGDNASMSHSGGTLSNGRGAGGRLVVDGRDVAPLRIADTYRARLVGLLGRPDDGGALLLPRCSSVHGLGMTYALDVALLDADLRVVDTLVLPRFGLTRPRRGVRHILEAGAGAFARWSLTPGCHLGGVPTREAG
jgi:uncharacterized membrane protein (UPF0127 family)